MDAFNAIRLLILAAIWGASFMFMRIAAAELEASLLAESRLLLAALFLLLVGWRLGKALSWRRHWRHYLLLGALNSALPFLLIAYSAQTLSASMMSILNATAPIWGTMITLLWERQRLQPKTVLGLLLGIGGVALLVGFDSIMLQPGAMQAISAGLGAALCYGIASTYARHAPAVESFNNAHGSMWGASITLLPLLLFSPLPATLPSSATIGSVVAIGVLCSGIAYLLYFQLIEAVGAPSALTVGFLIPMFGVLWGWLFLDETVGWHTLAGTLVVIAGTVLVTGFSWRALRPKRAIALTIKERQRVAVRRVN